MLPLGYLLLEPDTKYQGKGTQDMRMKESSKRGPKGQIERKTDCGKQKPLRGKRDGGIGMGKNRRERQLVFWGEYRESPQLVPVLLWTYMCSDQLINQ